MRTIITALFGILFFNSCIQIEESAPFTKVNVTPIFSDSVSIRAIEVMNGSIGFAANKGVYGIVDTATDQVKTQTKVYDSILPHFRAVAHTTSNFFMLSVESPALLYKTTASGSMELVYKEEGKGVFYDAMTFVNDSIGIAVGDSVDGCLSIIRTTNGGGTWTKIACDALPKGVDGEGAFAASNTNIVAKGNTVWMATTSSTIYFSEDAGETWQLIQTPVVNDKPTQGIYSMAFYDTKKGIVIGGDYTDPESNIANKAFTADGGKTWTTIASGQNPNYKSCVQFVPNSNGNALVALGFTGIDYSSDFGTTWQHLSDESFYTLRFVNDSVAYAAGSNRIAKLVFN